jgi:kinesin family protein 5
LSESLGGNSKTCLIITVSPHSFNEARTLSSLQFGARARKIKNAPKVNKEYTVKELKKLLEKSEEKVSLLEI